MSTLLYLAICTKPDIAYTVGVLYCFNAYLGPKYQKAVKHLIRYICKTLNYKIEYSVKAASSALSPFIAFTNANHGGNLDNSHSTSSSILTIARGAIS